MKFIADRDILQREILIAHDIISGSNMISILSNVLIEASDNTLRIQATDLKVSFQTQIPIDTEIPGSTTVTCDKFLNVLRSFPEGDIDFELIENRLVISRKKERINFKLRCIPPQDYPSFTTFDEKTLTIGAQDFSEMIEQTIISVSDDETRFYMNGVYMEPGQNSLIMVSTDGRKLSYIERNLSSEVPFFEPVIIPPKFLNLIKKTSSREGSVDIAVSDTHIFADFDSHHLSSTLIEGKYPNYKRVIPMNQSKMCSIASKEFMEALKRVSLLVDQKSRRLLIDIEGDSLILSSEEQDLGAAKEQLTCEYNGEPIRMVMNCQYLMNPMRVINSDRVVLAFQDAGKAVTLRPDPEKDFFHVIMPMS